MRRFIREVFSLADEAPHKKIPGICYTTRVKQTLTAKLELKTTPEQFAASRVILILHFIRGIGK
ncbi:MAG: hypothetical protein E6J34_13065 [Chloroflexi bacterium]|nr:MAG: hypothetical protein E6J34_13065 [Chloroflexota bacterium]